MMRRNDKWREMYLLLASGLAISLFLASEARGQYYYYYDYYPTTTYASGTFNLGGYQNYDQSYYFYNSYFNYYEVDTYHTTVNVGTAGNANPATLNATVAGTQVYSYGLQAGAGGTGTVNLANGSSWTASNTNLGVNSSDHGTISVNGTGSSLTTYGTAEIGVSGTGTLTLQNGGQATATTNFVGYLGGSQGAVTVDGAHSQFTSMGNTDVGYSGTGALTIQNGGQESAQYNYVGFNTSSQGTVTVTGAGSNYQSTGTSNSSTYVGYSGTGNFTVSNGGHESATDRNYLGYNAGSHGTVTVDGSGSQFTSGGVTAVGYSGTGTLYVQNGGLERAQDNSLGSNSTGVGTITVTGAGSSFQSTSTTTVGSSGTGTLNVYSGGHATAATSYIGSSSTAHGTVTVDGSGSQFTSSGTTYVGYSGTGTLNVQNGGLATAATTYVAYGAGSHGTVNINSAGSLQTTNLYVGGSSLGAGGTGIVNVNPGGSLVINSGGQATVWSTGTLNVNGNLINNGTFTNSGGTLTLGSNAVLSGSGAYNAAFTIAHGTTLSPGNSPGSMTFNGNQTWGSGGELDWQILHTTGSAGTDWDSININGNLSLTATSLDPFLINLQSLSSTTTAGLLAGFDPTHSYEWLFLHASTISGFNSNEFAFLTSGFWNSFGGTFSVREVGNDLFVDYNAPTAASATPVPSSLALLLAGVPGGCGVWYRRRYRSNG